MHTLSRNSCNYTYYFYAYQICMVSHQLYFNRKVKLKHLATQNSALWWPSQKNNNNNNRTMCSGGKITPVSKSAITHSWPTSSEAEQKIVVHLLFSLIMDCPLSFHHFHSQCSIGEKTRTEKSVKMIIFLIWTSLCFCAMQLERAGSGSAAPKGNLKHLFSGLMVSMFEYAPRCTRNTSG